MWAMRPQNYDNNKIIEWYIHHDIIDPDIWTSTDYNWWRGRGGGGVIVPLKLQTDKR